MKANYRPMGKYSGNGTCKKHTITGKQSKRITEILEENHAVMPKDNAYKEFRRYEGKKNAILRMAELTKKRLQEDKNDN